MSDSPYVVTSYQVEIKGDRATIKLESTETPNMMGGSRIATAEYTTGAEPAELINRGGFLSITRPLELLGPTLDLLRNESPVYLHEDGTIATSVEPIGEADADTPELSDAEPQPD